MADKYVGGLMGSVFSSVLYGYDVNGKSCSLVRGNIIGHFNGTLYLCANFSVCMLTEI